MWYHPHIYFLISKEIIKESLWGQKLTFNCDINPSVSFKCLSPSVPPTLIATVQGDDVTADLVGAHELSVLGKR